MDTNDHNYLNIASSSIAILSKKSAKTSKSQCVSFLSIFFCFNPSSYLSICLSFSSLDTTAWFYSTCVSLQDTSYYYRGLLPYKIINWQQTTATTTPTYKIIHEQQQQQQQETCTSNDSSSIEIIQNRMLLLYHKIPSFLYHII